MDKDDFRLHYPDIYRELQRALQQLGDQAVELNHLGKRISNLERNLADLRREVQVRRDFIGG